MRRLSLDHTRAAVLSASRRPFESILPIFTCMERFAWCRELRDLIPIGFKDQANPLTGAGGYSLFSTLQGSARSASNGTIFRTIMLNHRLLRCGGLISAALDLLRLRAIPIREADHGAAKAYSARAAYRPRCFVAGGCHCVPVRPPHLFRRFGFSRSHR